MIRRSIDCEHPGPEMGGRLRCWPDRGTARPLVGSPHSVDLWRPSSSVSSTRRFGNGGGGRRLSFARGQLAKQKLALLVVNDDPSERP